MKLWRSSDSTCLRSYAGETVHQVAFSPSGEFLAYARGGTLILARNPLAVVPPDTNGVVWANSCAGRLDHAFQPDVGPILNEWSSRACMWIQPDGKILVGGDFGEYDPVGNLGAFFRLNPDGSYDEAFVGSTAVTSLAVQPDGKIVVADYKVWRLMPNGGLDEDFACSLEAEGILRTQVALQRDGRILIGVDFFSVNETPQLWLARLQTNGSLDLTFSPSTNDIASPVTAVLVQPDGKILVTGAAYHWVADYLVRLHPDGSRDETFHPDLVGGMAAMALQPDGKLIVAGVHYPGDPSYGSITRLNPDGSRDWSFNPHAYIKNWGGLGASAIIRQQHPGHLFARRRRQDHCQKSPRRRTRRSCRQGASKQVTPARRRSMRLHGGMTFARASVRAFVLSIARNRFIGSILLALGTASSSLGQNLLALATTYRETCDASAAVALDADCFVVASDEDNVLRVYSLSRPGPPVSKFNLSTFLHRERKAPETDMEGAARIGNRIFWISSHGAAAASKANPNRQRFFATDIRTTNDQTTIVPVGTTCQTLLSDLIREPKFSQFNLARAAETHPDKPGTLNIEGLAATPEGHLLIGFRSPIPKGKALVIPLLNPNAVIEGAAASFGDAVLLDLNGLGLRSLEYAQGNYWIIAGHYDNKVPARLYSWASGNAKPRWHEQINLAGFNPEAMFFPGDAASATFYILSDDGGVSIGDKDCKDLKDPSQKRFRCYPVTIRERADAN